MSWLERSGIKNKDGDLDPDQIIGNAQATPIIEDERGIPSVNQRSFTSKAMPMALAALAFAVAGVVWLIPSPQVAPKKIAGDPKATIGERFDEGALTNILAPSRPPGPDTSAAKPNDSPIKVIPAPDGKITPTGHTTAGAKKELTPFELRQVSHPTIGPNNNVSRVEPATAPGAAAATPAQTAIVSPPNQSIPSLAQPEAKDSPLDKALTASKFKAVSATQIPDRTFTIAQGAMVHCTLDTAISSDQPGMTKCTTTRHIYGDDGKVILLDRGTELTGQYQAGLKQGQARIFVLWTRAKTTKGVLIDLASPGTDTLGRTGFDGEIDKHFFERFGAAMLLSIVDDVAGAVAQRYANRGSGGGNTFFPSSTASTSKDAASIAVENTINIPPTLNKNQGEQVSVFVARDLDFRSVYSLKVASDR